MSKIPGKFLVILLGVLVFSVPLVPQFLNSHGETVAAIANPAAPQDRPITSLRDLNQAFTDIASDVTPTVVTVFTEKTLTLRQNPFFAHPFFDLFGGPRYRQQPEEREFRQQGLGSGVIVSSDGNILTNYHVIAEADSIYVRTIDDRRFPARVIGSDSKTDIAVIKIDADNLKAIRIGNSDDLKVGEFVLAIGSPMSENLAHTVTQGIVSAKGRSNIGLADYEDFIQTDAAINPGNSGGALVNLDGELIGINSAIASRSGGYQGVGFAVPSNMALNIMNSLVKGGKVVRGWLGVSIQNINEAIANAMGLKERKGALVGDVLTDSPADKAGLEPGDVIVEMDGKPIADASVLRNTVAATAPGTEVALVVLRDGDRVSLKVELGELEADDEAGPSEGLGDLLGFDISNLDSELARRYDLNPNMSGVVVTAIDQTSAAFRAGLREGDIIYAVNRDRVETVAEFNRQMEGAQKGDSVLMRIFRNDNTFFLAFTL